MQSFEDHITEMQDALSCVVRLLVIHKSDVKVTRVLEEDILHFQVLVAKSDLGLVIGRQGRTAKAIRTLLNASSQGKKMRYTLQISGQDQI